MWKVLKFGCAGVLALIVVSVVIVRFGAPDAGMPARNPGGIARFPLAADTVEFDYRRKKIYVVATVPASAFNSNDSTFVWAFATNVFESNGQVSWSDLPVAATEGADGKVRVDLGFHWASNPDIPHAGWRVFVFAGDSPESVQVRSAERDKSPERATTPRVIE